jgi:hypothetical protein
MVLGIMRAALTREITGMRKMNIELMVSYITIAELLAIDVAINFHRRFELLRRILGVRRERIWR